MARRLRRQLRLLQAYALLSALAFAVLAAAAFRQAPAPPRFDEITVGRINVVEGDGTLRLVISNRERMHPGVIDGVTIDRVRPTAGLIFFNDEGDEAGGLAFSGQAREGGRRASAQIAFDQLKQDQTVAISYSESDGGRFAGLQVWDRSERPISELIKALNAANAIQDRPEREKALQAARAAAPAGPRRLFAGKNTEKQAIVSLADADGRARLNLVVDAGGAARIDFLDASGTVVRSYRP
jgi:hypothetical protein